MAHSSRKSSRNIPISPPAATNGRWNELLSAVQTTSTPLIEIDFHAAEEETSKEHDLGFSALPQELKLIECAKTKENPI